MESAPFITLPTSISYRNLGEFIEIFRCTTYYGQTQIQNVTLEYMYLFVVGLDSHELCQWNVDR